MDVDDNDILEIKQNTAVTREKVEQLESKFKKVDDEQETFDNRLDNHDIRITRIEMVGTVAMFIVALLGVAGAFAGVII